MRWPVQLRRDVVKAANIASMVFGELFFPNS